MIHNLVLIVVVVYVKRNFNKGSYLWKQNIVLTSLLSKDSLSITWHQWQVEYPTDKNIILFLSFAALKASSPQGYQWTGLAACWRRYGDLSSFNLFLDWSDDEDEAIVRQLNNVDLETRCWNLLFLGKNIRDVSRNFSLFSHLGKMVRDDDAALVVVDFGWLVFRRNFLCCFVKVWVINLLSNLFNTDSKTSSLSSFDGLSLWHTWNIKRHKNNQLHPNEDYVWIKDKSEYRISQIMQIVNIASFWSNVFIIAFLHMRLVIFEGIVALSHQVWTIPFIFSPLLYYLLFRVIWGMCFVLSLDFLIKMCVCCHSILIH